MGTELWILVLGALPSALGGIALGYRHPSLVLGRNTRHDRPA